MCWRSDIFTLPLDKEYYSATVHSVEDDGRLNELCDEDECEYLDMTTEIFTEQLCYKSNALLNMLQITSTESTVIN